ncbi:MAG TPA: LLM class flavin-dependent oxidoreductase [Actinophytocola sp.]|jgi:alkanesulfonate monooxygenase SsuD/methylene tetrahydromethanopterin reductase-like flavin-dependent oxidoreductase (luciferase family)|nr:LLM class flavin-dependent oxidoreductase [Actinophytocola sp.]
MSLHTIDRRVRRALVFTPMETRRDVLVSAAVLAEELGYEAVVVPEGWGLDAGIVLAEIAVRTSHIRLVSGVFSVWGRSPATLAMAAATLDDLSGGRFTLGLGASTPALAERFHGVEFADPAGRLRSTARQVRALLRGERVDVPGAGRRLALGQPARPGLPLWIAGLGPRTTAVATEYGDGWFPAFLPRDRVGEIRARVRESATGDPELICGPGVALDAPALPARRIAEQMVGWYLTGMGPFYGDFVAANGYTDEVAALRAANPKPVPSKLVWPRSADPLLSQVAVFGDAADVHTGLAAWDGLVDVVAVCVGPGPAESVLAQVAAGAPATAGKAIPVAR